MDFKFANLLGAPYRGGNILLAGTELLSPVGNRVSQVWREAAPLFCCSLLQRQTPRVSNAREALTSSVCMQIDLTSSTSSTLPFEALKQVTHSIRSC